MVVRRRLADSNRCKRLCRPLPNHSAKAPGVGHRIRARRRVPGSSRKTPYTVAFAVSLQERTATERIQEARERYVARGISTPPIFVDRAEGARIWDVDGREYIDFAGGIGCANVGHSLPAVVEAVHEQVDRYLHQCAMVGMYEPYVEVCRRLAELSPCRGADQKSLLLNSGAEAIENAVKIARVATGRPAVIVFDNAFHGRTLLSMTMTVEGRPVQEGIRPVRARGVPHPGAVPVPRRHRGRRDRRAEASLQGRRRPAVGRVRRARARAGRGRLHPDDARLPEAAAGAARRARDPLRRRRGAVGLRPHRAGLGDRALRTSSPTCSSAARRSAAACRSPRSRAAPR